MTRIVVRSVAVLAALAACQRQSGPPAAAPEKPAARASERAARTHDFDALRYRLDLLVDPERKRFEGSVEIDFLPLAPDFRSLRLDCGDYAVKEARRGGQALAFDTNGESLEIRFPEALPRGREASVRIEYEGLPSKGIYFVGPTPEEPKKPYQVYTQGECEDIRYVFPCYDFPNDKATSELIVTVPEKYKTVAAGAMTSSTPASEPGWRSDHWRMDVAHSSYLTTLAVGEFAEVREEWDGIPVLYYGDPGDEEALRRSFGKTPKAMQFFSEYIGVRYPYPKYAQVCVHDFMFCGMENISATTQTRLTLHEKSSEPLASSDGLMAHELAHQWWGDLVTCADWSHIWLNEGFATYFEALFREFDRGEDEFRFALRGQQEAACRADEKERRPIVYGVYRNPLDLFFSGHVYPGGSSRLHLLRFVLGEETFRKGIRRYAESFRERNATTEDFRRVLEESSGKDLEEFFEQWLYSPGFPKFRVRYDWEEESSLLRMKVEQTQKARGGVLPAYRTPVLVSFVLSVDPPVREEFRVTVSEKAETFLFRLAAKPLLHRFDRGGWIPKTLDEEKSPDEWLFQLRRDEDVIGRLEAARAIGKLLDEKAKPPLDPVVRERLIEGLDAAFERESFYGVSNEILAALAASGSDLARKCALAALAHEDARVRRKAVSSLGHFEGDARVGQALRRLFGAEKNGYVAAEVPAALVRAKDPGAAEFLLEAIERDSDGDAIRSAALKALGDLRHPQAVPLGIRFAGSGYSARVRSAAIRLLGKVGEGQIEVVELLGRLLDASYAGVRSGAAEALGKLCDGRALPFLAARFSREPFSPARRAIEKAMERIEEGSEPEAARSQHLLSKRRELERRALRLRDEILEREGRLEELRSQIAEQERDLEAQDVPGED